MGTFPFLYPAAPTCPACAARYFPRSAKRSDGRAAWRAVQGNAPFSEHLLTLFSRLAPKKKVSKRKTPGKSTASKTIKKRKTVKKPASKGKTVKARKPAARKPAARKGAKKAGKKSAK